MDLKGYLRLAVRKLGYDLVHLQSGDSGAGLVPYDLTEAERQTYFLVRPFTQTTLERVVALCHAVKYVVERGVPGAFVECGVKHGGSVMAMASTLGSLGVSDRDIYLFDTFEGKYFEPGTHDSKHARSMFAAQERGERVVPEYEQKMSELPQVKKTVLSTGYPEHRFHFVEGLVEDTVPQKAPSQIAILRLDTDYYGSTKHELVHLFPRLVDGGILIIDDYACPAWPGARRATDEYFQEQGLHPFLSRIDADARLMVKSAEARR